MDDAPHAKPNPRGGKGLPALADMNQMPPLPIQQPPQRPTTHRPQRAWNSFQNVVLGVVAVAILSAAGLGILGSILFPEGTRVPAVRLRAFCQNNLKQMGVVYRMWAYEHDGTLPPLAPVPGEFCAASATIFPEYLTELTVLDCPSDPDVQEVTDSAIGQVTDRSYFYLGYTVTNEAEARVFVEAYKKRAAEGGGFEEDLIVAPGSGTGGSDRILRLHDDVDKALQKATGIASASVAEASEIPIMFDCDANHHVSRGINVLYLDGHVVFVKLEKKFPAQQWFLDALAELER
jgi:prepilin-type processing-associated H-X9-DG protein